MIDVDPGHPQRLQLGARLLDPLPVEDLDDTDAQGDAEADRLDDVGTRSRVGRASGDLPVACPIGVSGRAAIGSIVVGVRTAPCGWG
ncbi:hypothetical protein LO762_06615 [Actinocorallia sp. API 0066]|uniref:hypothetical protein n=1 Tax=Actinocorallia sp. API 0066 TaxID=2896846 RepID=UPI001E337C77|nr:hypothetical protein [Actinocorallia sp. API 0066]MCD0448861.1 hypothetical protein [Actinocorallia sp. API 0066]